MGAESLTLFLRQQLRKQNLSSTEIAKRANISRQTWYNILNANIREVKLSTLISVGEALSVPPVKLLDIYFDGRVSAGKEEEGGE